MRIELIRKSCLAILVLAAIVGCSTKEDTSMSKQDVANFKGSKEMSDEAKKHMAEGMKRMEEIRKSNGQSGFTPGSTK